MITPLQQEFEDLQREGKLKLLESAMLKCKSPNPKIGVTVVGAGDAFVNRYWPTLLTFVNKQKIVLSIADKMSLKALAAEKDGELRKCGTEEANALADKLQAGYEQLGAFLDTSQRSAVQYFDLSTDTGEHSYRNLHLTDFVFVLVPDHIHLQEARAWLPRATLVLVEKPYASSIVEAQEFETEYNRLQRSETAAGGNAMVVPFDHYFAKIAPCIKVLERGDLSQLIGEAQSIEFLLTESRLPEAHRLETLRGGLMADLYPHILAVLSMFVELKAIDHSKLKVEVARVSGNPFPTETYARFESRMWSYDGHLVQVTATLGKGIGKHDEKYVIVRGSQGRLVVNFSRHPELGEPQVSWIRGNPPRLTPEVVSNGKLCEVYPSGHAEFIQILLEGGYLDEPRGGLMRSQAHLIMRELDALRQRVTNLGSMAEYEPKVEKDKIAATRLR